MQLADGTHTITLAKPVTAHGETHSTLTLRRPTVKELRLCGSPYRIVQGGVRWDYDAYAKLISAICNIPPSSVDQMDGADFAAEAALLVGFTKRAPLGESAATSPSKS